MGSKSILVGTVESYVCGKVVRSISEDRMVFCIKFIFLYRAAETKCMGTPDLYKHYREARFTQTKHHWWWKANK